MNPSIKAIVSLFILFWTTCSYSQMIVDAGKDTILCYDGGDSIILGGKPTAKGGIEPYRYKWTFVIFDFDNKKIVFQNNIINNDTIANPIFNEGYLLGDFLLKFYVNVSENNQNTGTDSIMITLSSVGITTRIGNIPSINIGDTCQLVPLNIVYGFLPLKYAWTPIYNLSDPNIEKPFAWPEKYTQYSVVVTDSVGCKGYDFVDVEINTVGIQQLKYNSNYTITNNPISDNSTLNFNFSVGSARLSIYGFNGIAIYDKKIISNIVEIGKIIKMPGLYIFTLEKNNEIISRGKFLKE
jgi:hypothetical protein